MSQSQQGLMTLRNKCIERGGSAARFDRTWSLWSVGEADPGFTALTVEIDLPVSMTSKLEAWALVKNSFQLVGNVR